MVYEATATAPVNIAVIKRVFMVQALEAAKLTWQVLG